MVESKWLGGKARMLACRRFADERGVLTPFEFDNLGFEMRRVALIQAFDGSMRGGHAHREGAQLLVCLSGRVDVTMRLGDESAQVTLEPGGDALYIESPVWSRQVYRGESPSLLLMCDKAFDPNLYIDQETRYAARESA